MKIFQLTALAMAIVAASTSIPSVYANAIEAEQPYFLEDAIDIDTVSSYFSDFIFVLVLQYCLYQSLPRYLYIDVYPSLT